MRTGCPSVSTTVIGPQPLSPASSRPQAVSTSAPSGRTAPRPVTTTLRRTGASVRAPPAPPRHGGCAFRKIATVTLRRSAIVCSRSRGGGSRVKASITVHVESLWTNRAELTVEAELDNPHSETNEKVVSLMFDAMQRMCEEARGENERVLFSQRALNERHLQIDAREERLDERERRVEAREHEERDDYDDADARREPEREVHAQHGQ